MMVLTIPKIRAKLASPDMLEGLVGVMGGEKARLMGALRCDRLAREVPRQGSSMYVSKSFGKNFVLREGSW